MPKITPAASEASLPPGMRIMGTSIAFCLCDLKPWEPSCSKHGAGRVDQTRSCPGSLGWGLPLSSDVAYHLCTQPSSHTLLCVLPWTAPVATYSGPLTPPSPNKFPPSMTLPTKHCMVCLGRLAVLHLGNILCSDHWPLLVYRPTDLLQPTWPPNHHTSIRCLSVSLYSHCPSPCPIPL